MTRALKFFTVEQANRALPYVRRIVADLKASHAELARLRRAHRSGTGHGAPVPDAVRREERSIHRCLDELQTVGCELKEIETGLVDFYARTGDKVILLCWMDGEDRIRWWHTLREGFRGRRSVSELPARTLGV